MNSYQTILKGNMMISVANKNCMKSKEPSELCWCGERVYMLGLCFNHWINTTKNKDNK